MDLKMAEINRFIFNGRMKKKQMKQNNYEEEQEAMRLEQMKMSNQAAKQHRQYLNHLAQKSIKKQQELEAAGSEDEVKFFEYQTNDNVYVRRDSKIMDQLEENVQYPGQEREDYTEKPEPIEEVKEIDEQTFAESAAKNESFVSKITPKQSGKKQIKAKNKSNLYDYNNYSCQQGY